MSVRDFIVAAGAFGAALVPNFAAASDVPSLTEAFAPAPAAASPVEQYPPYFLGAPIRPGWSFVMSPYGWFANIATKVNFRTPAGGSASADLFFPFADYVHHLHFAFMGAAEARYDNFSLLNDLLYVSLGGSSKHSHLTSVAPVEGSPSIPAGLRTSMSVSLQAAVWTTAVGYTLASGPWGYFEPILGVRMLRIDATADYGLLAAVQGPNNIIVLPKSGSLRTARTEWDGVVGVRGRYEIAGTRFFIPYYFDVGTGDLPLTWQGFSGVGCHFAKADLSIGYRYLAYTNRAGAQVDNLSMGGLIAAATFRF